MRTMSKRAASPAHEVCYQELAALLARQATQGISPMQVLAIAANMVGKLVALQDQRKVTPAEAMELVAKNIEEGNAQALAKVRDSKGTA